MTSLMLQPEASHTAASSSARGAVKSLLLHIQDDEGLEARLQAALAIVRASSGHLACLQASTTNPIIGFETFGTGYVVADLINQFEAQEAALRSRIEARLGNEDVAWSYDRIAAIPGAALADAGALADLIVVGRSNSNQSAAFWPGSVPEEILRSSRTPMLICSKDQASFDPFGPAVVAWNGSFEAANALRAALPLLKQASSVHIVTVDDDKQYDFPPLGASEYLSRHDVGSELVREAKGTLAVEDRLIATAYELDASYLVMGAYGHSRAREFLFGGVTRSLLKQCPLALVVAR